MQWRESQHPRDRRGRFRDKAGGWVEVVSDAIGTAATGHAPARGRDLHDSPEVDWDGLAAIVASQSGDSFDESAPDDALGLIYEMQGYHGSPRVVSRDEMDRLVASGWTETWRGLVGQVNKTDLQEADRRVAAFLHGPRHRAGRGVYGNGSYAGNLQEASGYAAFDFASTRALHGNDFSAVDALYDDPHSGYWHGLVRVALPPDARVVDVGDAMEFYRDIVIGTAGLTSAARTHVLADLGRAAALRGYDAIRIPQGWGRGSDYYVVLNRSILAVQEVPGV